MNNKILTRLIYSYLPPPLPLFFSVCCQAVELMKLFDTRTKQLVLGAQVCARLTD